MDLTRSLQRLRQDAELWSVFNTVNRWIPAWRYTADLSKRDDAEDFFSAVERLMKWVDNNV